MAENTIYEELGVPTVVNAAGTKTRIGGSLMPPEVLDAMCEAGNSFVRLSDLQAAASERIADLTGAGAGYVTNGAAGALLLGTAACIAGSDLGAMSRLPDTEGLADEVVMARTHRTGYDHAIRAAGARVVDVGTNDRFLGSGASSVEPWEIADAIGPDTAAVGYVQTPETEPPLEDVVAVAGEHDVPVIVDAAAELPPVENFSRFIDAGADLVAFSGGKAIRGPQTTGILAGRPDLIASVALQHLDAHAAPEIWEPPEGLVPEPPEGVPRQGIGRPLKVGKEELVGLLRAIELFVDADHDARRETYRERIELIDDRLSGLTGLRTDVVGPEGYVPVLRVRVDAGKAGVSAKTLVRSLREEDPRVFVSADYLERGEFTVVPSELDDGEASYVADRIASYAG
jgi:L-seryl-tRNA(Ser) seleniumtransferase